MMPLYLTLFLAVGGALTCLSIPLIQQKVAPNRWYGFCVRRTLEDPNIWYPVNAHTGWRMLWVGIVTIVVAITAYFVPGLEQTVYASIVVVVLALGVTVGLVQSFIYLRKLTDEKTKDKSDGESAA